MLLDGRDLLGAVELVVLAAVLVLRDEAGVVGAAVHPLPLLDEVQGGERVPALLVDLLEHLLEHFLLLLVGVVVVDLLHPLSLELGVLVAEPEADGLADLEVEGDEVVPEVEVGGRLLQD